MSRLPEPARAGLMRAWLAILSERHPGVTWVEREQDATLRVGGDESDHIPALATPALPLGEPSSEVGIDDDALDPRSHRGQHA